MSAPTPAPQPSSPRVRDLSQRLQQTIAEFQRQYPMTPAELDEAVRLAAEACGATPVLKWSVRRTVFLVLVVVGLPFVMTAIIRALR